MSGRLGREVSGMGKALAIGCGMLALVGVVAVAQASDAAGGRQARDRSGPPGLDPGGCAACHGQTHRQWARSEHATAWTDPAFQASWRAWPVAWCVNCHAPGIPHGAQPGARLDPDDPALAQPGGVDCAACHVHDGALWSAQAPGRAGRRAHPLSVDPALGDGSQCAECHDFPFQRHSPVWPMTWSNEPLQDTWDEWKASSYAARGVGCVDCHLPRGRHEMTGGHDLDRLRQALDLQLSWGPDGLRATLKATGVGHRVPTGDPFRRLILEVCPGSDSDCPEPIGRLVWGRSFARSTDSWVLVEDSSLPPPTAGDSAQRSLSLPLDAGQAAGSWRLSIGYADSSLKLPADLALGRISQGKLPPRPRSTP